MKILINGASGFVGGWLIRSLSEQGHVGVAVSRARISVLPYGWSWVARDELLADSSSARYRFDVVVHLEVQQHISSPTKNEIQLFREVNIDGVGAWLDWCQVAGATRFIYFSSIKAAGTCREVQDEETRTLPSSPYGQSKLEAEYLVRKWTLGDRIRCGLILRPAVIYGAGNTANMNAIVRGIANGTFALVGRNDNVKSIVAIENVCAAVGFLLPRLKLGCELFYVVDQNSYTVRDVAEMIGDALGRKPREIPASIARLLAWIGDTLHLIGLKFPVTSSRLKSLTEHTHFSGRKLTDSGFSHPVDTKTALRAMANKYKQETKTK